MAIYKRSRQPVHPGRIFINEQVDCSADMAHRLFDCNKHIYRFLDEKNFS